MKCNYRLCLVICYIVLYVPVYSQYKISGTISSSHQQPVGYAFASLLQKVDSMPLQTVMADSLGVFQMESERLPQEQALRVSAIGYEDAVIGLDTVADISSFHVTLEQLSDSLGDITVSGRKPLFERKPDRMIFNAAQSAVTLGGTALDIIRKTPGVLYRQQDNSFSIIGKSNVQVLLNDRLVQLAGDNLVAYLQAIPAANVNRIEVIYTPPANYDAAGNSGLINIVLLKNSSYGLSGSTNLAFEQAYYGRGTAGGNLSYSNAKISLYGNINYSSGANNIAERLNTPYILQQYKVSDYYKRVLRPLQYTMGINYELHRNGILGVEWSGSILNRVNETTTGIEVRRLNTTLLDSTMLTEGLSTVKSSNHVLNINYAWDIDTTGKKLTVNLNRLWFDGKRNNDFSTTTFIDDFMTPIGARIRNGSAGKQDIDIITMQADMEMPCKWGVFSFGGKLGFIDNKSDNRFGAYDNGGYIENVDVSNAFDYNERVQALYLKAGKSIGKWSLQAGLRGEFTQTKGYSIKINQVNKNSYFNIFPTLYLQYQPATAHSFNVSYSKRINRPDYRSLDPFRAYATPYHYNEGNPFLQPSFSHNIELAYAFNSRYFCSVFYQYTQNHFGSVWLTDAQRKITSGISMNFAGFISYGISFSSSLQPFKWLQLQPQLSIMRQQLRSEVYSVREECYQSAMYYAGINGTALLNRTGTFLADFSLFYISRYREDFLEIDPLGSVDLGLKCLLFQKKLVIGLSGNDVLATQKARGVHIVSGQTINNYFDTRNVKVSFSYKFGSNAGQRKNKADKGIEEEQKRAG